MKDEAWHWNTVSHIYFNLKCAWAENLKSKNCVTVQTLTISRLYKIDSLSVLLKQSSLTLHGAEKLNFILAISAHAAETFNYSPS